MFSRQSAFGEMTVKTRRQLLIKAPLGLLGAVAR
jgi:hypothetical protein